MPILQREPDLYPDDLFEVVSAELLQGRQQQQGLLSLPDQQTLALASEPANRPASRALHNELPSQFHTESRNEENSPATWWVMYCLSQQEKKLMRWLRARGIAHYCPLYEKRWKAGNGRKRTSYLPLFSNYLFLFGDAAARYTALTSGCVSRWLAAPAPEELTADLERIWRAIGSGLPLVPETQLVPGRRVRVHSGRLEGLEGVIVRRQGQTRLLVAVNFIQQGASLQVDECELELVDDDWHARHGLRLAGKQCSGNKIGTETGKDQNHKEPDRCRK